MMENLLPKPGSLTKPSGGIDLIIFEERMSNGRALLRQLLEKNYPDYPTSMNALIEKITDPNLLVTAVTEVFLRSGWEKVQELLLAQE